MAEALYTGTGRRKTAVARVRIAARRRHDHRERPRPGRVLPRARPTARPSARRWSSSALPGRYEVVAKIEGGGPTGQAEALRHGIARALAEESQEARGELKAAGLLTRDPRAVERKKYGLKKARKRPQFSKR